MLVNKYQQENFDSPNGRYIYLMKKLLLANDFVKMDDLAKTMYVSKATVSNDLKRVKETLQKYNLMIKTTPHYGMKIEGEEQRLRQCIIDNGIIDNSVFSPNSSLDVWSVMLNDDSYKEIESIVSRVIANDEYKMFRSFLNNLIMHVYVSFKRIQSNCIVGKIEVKDPKYFLKEYELAMAIAKEIELLLDIEIPTEEINYLQLHLIGKQRNDYDRNIYPEIELLVKKMVQVSDQRYNYNFSKDKILKNDLFYHVKAAKLRLEEGSQMRNPLLEEIKGRYPMAFEIALSSISDEENWIEILSEDEIAYIAVHFAASIERQKIGDENAIKRVLVICASGIGTARLMEVKIKRRFMERIELIVKESKMGVTKALIDEFDLTLTTVPLSNIVDDKILMIHAIPTKAELDKIEEILFPVESRGYRIEQVFKEKYIEKGNIDNKEELLKHMVKKLEKDEIVDNTFIKSVYERESFSSTYVGNLVALPHAIIPSAKESVIYTYILEKPIKWDENGIIQVVFLLAIEFSKSKYFSEIYDLIVDIVENSDYLSEIISVGNPKEFIERIIDIQMRGR